MDDIRDVDLARTVVLVHQDRVAPLLNLRDHLVLDGDARYFGLQTPFFTTIADDFVFEEGGVSELSGETRASVVDFTVDNDPDRYAASQIQVDDILLVAGASFRIFAVAFGARVVLDQHRMADEGFDHLGE